MIEPRDEKVYWRGRASPAVAKWVARLLKPGDVFWDVGSHIGYISFVASRSVGPTGQVHAFEPLPANIGRLRQGLQLNAITNITVHPVAVSDTNGPALLRRHDCNHMWSLVENEPVGVEVSCVTLDSMLSGLPVPQLVKIDVEGAELLVLAGARRVLELHPMLIVELLTAEDVERARRLLPEWNFERIDQRNSVVRYS